MTWHELPDEIEQLAGALLRETGTSATGTFLSVHAGRFRNDWLTSGSMRAAQMPLPLPRNQGLHPVGCELGAAYLGFHFERTGDAVLPVRADYQVQTEGLLSAGSALFELQDHWRIDTDFYAAPAPTLGGDTGDVGRADGEAKEAHPLYHFQRGGHAQKAFAGLPEFLPSTICDLNGEWKGLMQCAGPRIPALPLDPILAIDFCISQSDGLIWRRLRASPEYFAVVEEAQKRLWTPFFDALSEASFRRAWLGTYIACLNPLHANALLQVLTVYPSSAVGTMGALPSLRVTRHP